MPAPFRLPLLLLLLVGMAPVPAWGHAELQATEPEAGAVLAAPVPALVFRFNEPVRPVAGRLTRPDGVTIALRAEGAGATIRLILPDALTQGSYLAVLRVVSADAHPVAASLPFALGGPTGLAPAQTEAESRAGIAALRWARDIVLLTGAGIGLYLALVLGPGSASFRLLARSAAVSGGFALVLILLEFGAAGVRLTGSRDLLAWPIWRAAWDTSLRGASLCQGLGALALVLLPFARPRRIAFLGPVAAVLVAVGLALTGHAARDLTGIDPFALALHVLGAAFWIGALAALLRNSGDAVAAARDVPRFSALAMPIVGILLIAGLVLAWRIGLAGGFSTESPYQRLLALKIGLVLPLLGLAAFNRFRLTPAIAKGNQRALRLLRLSIGGEILLAAAILAVTAFLSQTPPGTRLAAEPATWRIGLAGEGLRAELVVTGRAVEASVGRAEGGAFAPLSLRIEAELEDGASIGADLTLEGRDYAGMLPALPPRSIRRYCLIVLVTDFERRRLCGSP